MGTPFSRLDRHGGCYNFGVLLSSKYVRKDSTLDLSIPNLSLSPDYSCDACRIAFNPGASLCVHRHHLCSAHQTETVPQEATNLATFSENISAHLSLFCPEDLSQRTPRHSTTCDTTMSTVTRETNTECNGVVVIEPDADEVFSFEKQDMFHAAFEPFLSHSLSTQRLKTVHSLLKLTRPAELTQIQVSHLRTLLSSWSFDELKALYAHFEDLLTLRTALLDAVDARPKAPSLGDDLRALCSSGWCYNLQLSYGDTLRGAHSYILAYRSPVFAEVLQKLYHVHFGSKQPKTGVPILTILLPCVDDGLLKSSAQDTVFVPSQSSPDLLPPNSRTNSKRCHKRTPTKVNLSGTSVCSTPVQERHSAPTSKLQTSVNDRLVNDFLEDLYVGITNSLTFSFDSSLNHSPLKQKPDILCSSDGPSCCTQYPSSLLPLFNFGKIIEVGIPIGPDCRLVFSCEHGTACHPLELHCHAGLLAARSHFLRRLLHRRYCPPGPKSDLTTIVFDATLLSSNFAYVLVHFFYSDFLDFNCIANVYSRKPSQPSNKDIAKGCTQVQSDGLHSQWHTEHCKRCGRKSPCCIGRSSKITEPAAYLEHQARCCVKRHSQCIFCLACPFCLSHLLDLHPVGQFLEFPRFSEACEDLIVRALRFRNPRTVEHKNSVCKSRDTFESWQDTSIHSSFPRMTPISLAVGLLQWADNTNHNSSSIASSTESVIHKAPATTHEPPTTYADESTKTVSGMQSTDGSITCKQTSSSDSSGWATRYLHRQAMQCLRDNFMELARSPALLRRLRPKQFRELIQSSLIQAPESEVLAALLCWSEQRLNYVHENRPVNQTMYTRYMSLVLSLCEHSEWPSNTTEHPQRDFNPWLLSDLVSENHSIPSPNKACQHDWQHSQSVENVKRVDSVKCDLCNLTATAISTEAVNLDTLIKPLHQYGLLDCLRPAHLLHPVPLGLATIMLQYQLAGLHSEKLSVHHLLPGNKLLNTGPSTATQGTFCDSVSSHQTASISNRFSQWIPLLIASLKLLPPSASYKKIPSKVSHPVLVSKLGQGPLADLPPSSPAQAAHKSAWIPGLSSTICKIDIANVIPCHCQYTKSRFPVRLFCFPLLLSLIFSFDKSKKSIVGSKSPSRTAIHKSDFALDSRCTCLRLLSTLASHYTMSEARTEAAHETSFTPAFRKSAVVLEQGIRRTTSNPVSRLLVQENTLEQTNFKHEKNQGLSLRSSCCTPECKEFSHCLLTADQWKMIIDRYFVLLKQIPFSHINKNIGEEMLYLFRLRSLREHGLPDSLHVLLACRINERLMHSQMFSRSTNSTGRAYENNKESHNLTAETYVNSSLTSSCSYTESIGSLGRSSKLIENDGREIYHPYHSAHHRKSRVAHLNVTFSPDGSVRAPDLENEPTQCLACATNSCDVNPQANEDVNTAVPTSESRAHQDYVSLDNISPQTPQGFHILDSEHTEAHDHAEPPLCWCHSPPDCDNWPETFTFTKPIASRPVTIPHQHLGTTHCERSTESCTDDTISQSMRLYDKSYRNINRQDNRQVGCNSNKKSSPYPCNLYPVCECYVPPFFHWWAPFSPTVICNDNHWHEACRQRTYRNQLNPCAYNAVIIPPHSQPENLPTSGNSSMTSSCLSTPSKSSTDLSECSFSLVTDE
ncbi:hypothetical protein EG68_04200 [Paragonimus skrjabini miyazakii]|uniref:BTB domain-containing protein n=1 Tax=Paragonimus skrjabini miyazakii TaxID=59628 RepID=A0A8S9YZM3_9TREM|nr:hypothetical protein EG68_04200 [Paragonimus skrjabini miyazakii]